MSETAVIVLAAGASTRMGRPKQLLPFRGRPLLRHAAETALAADCGPVLVVLGAGAEELREPLGDLPVEVVVNPRWQQGMGTSIQAGLQALDGRGVTGAILTLADQPFVTGEFLNSLAVSHRQSGKPIVAARYQDTVGVPVFFAREAFPLLLALPADQGCKGVILRNGSDALLIECSEAAIDVDTPEDYARASAG